MAAMPNVDVAKKTVVSVVVHCKTVHWVPDVVVKGDIEFVELYARLGGLRRLMDKVPFDTVCVPKFEMMREKRNQLVDDAIIEYLNSVNAFGAMDALPKRFQRTSVSAAQLPTTVSTTIIVENRPFDLTFLTETDYRKNVSIKLCSESLEFILHDTATAHPRNAKRRETRDRVDTAVKCITVDYRRIALKARLPRVRVCIVCNSAV